MTVYRKAFLNPSVGDNAISWALNKNKLGLGYPGYASAGAPQTTVGRELQLLTWSGQKSNGTITLLTDSSFGENGHCGMIGLNMTNSGLGVSRLYFLTGRYALTTLTMYQGGNRGAGEDASVAFTGGTNSFGLTLTSSGFPASQQYYVWAILGWTVNYGDKWLSN